MPSLLYLIYGGQEAYHLELTHSLLSAARALEGTGIRILLLSDAANQRPDLPAESLVVPEALLHEWQFGGRYGYAAKISALDHAMQLFPETAMALIDTDTVFHASPAKLFERIGAGRSLMHRAEHPLRDSPDWQDWQALLHHGAGEAALGSIGANSLMCNSGVIGLAPEDRPLLASISGLITRLLRHGKIRTIEQLAASAVLGTKTQLGFCDDLVEHYWDGARHYYHYQMKQIYPPRALDAPISAEAFRPLRSKPQPRLWDRLCVKLNPPLARMDPALRHAVIAYRSAFAESRADPDLANVWAQIALDMLRYGVEAAPEDISAHFHDFTPALVTRQSWLTPRLKAEWRAFWQAQGLARAAA